MSVSQVDTRIIGSTQLTLGVLGASVFPTIFKTPTGVWGGQMKLGVIGASSLVQIYPQAIAGASVGGATGVIAGYPLGATEVFAWNGPAYFYLAATGSTTTVAVTLNFTGSDTNLL